MSAPGAWEDHCEIEFLRKEKQFVIRAKGSAILSLNGKRIESAGLKNGDRFQAGGTEIIFSLAAAEQSSLTVQEAIFWFALAAVTLLQLLLV